MTGAAPHLLWSAENGACAASLPDGRLHFQHGPIDLVISATGADDAGSAAYRAGWERFSVLLDELVGELPALRRPWLPGAAFSGGVARRMAQAVAPHAEQVFVTPMAAVAGAVADEVLAAMTAATALDKAVVNNGGDIAIHLGEGQSATAAIADAAGRPLGRIRLDSESLVRGVATSGRHGRSLSLGVADSVTALARSAAAADAAATLIANAVDLPDHDAIRRAPANTLDPDSDLGERLVTVEVGRLGADAVRSALEAGRRAAASMLDAGLIEGASLHLRGAAVVVGGALATAEALAHSERRIGFGAKPGEDG